jgi:hypothetical protein
VNALTRWGGGVSTPASLILALGMAGCGDAGSASSVGVIQVVTATSGSSLDPDGYTVAIDDGGLRSVAAADVVTLPPVDAGSHNVGLTGVAPNCAVAGDSSRAVTVEADDTSEVVFEVSCTGTAGQVQFVTTTTGVELDPNGYTAGLGGALHFSLPPNGVYSATVPTGEYPLSLSGATLNCTLSSGVTGLLNVTTGGVTQARLSYHCTAATPAGRGHEIAFVTDRNAEDSLRILLNQIYLMNEDGTGLRSFQAVPKGLAFGLNWTREGSSIVFGARDADALFFDSGVYRLHIESGLIEKLPLVINGFSDLELAPDGERLAFTDNESLFRGEVVVARLDGSGRELISSNDVIHHGSPAWSPNGEQLAFVRYRERSGGSDDLGLGGEIVLATLGVPGEEPISATFPADLRPHGLTWSPDGTRIAFVGTVGVFGASSIYIIRTDGTGLSQLAGGHWDDMSPAWSPAGTRLAFASTRDGNSEIYVMDADGSNPVRITNNPASDEEPSWRP